MFPNILTILLFHCIGLHHRAMINQDTVFSILGEQCSVREFVSPCCFGKISHCFWASQLIQPVQHFLSGCPHKQSHRNFILSLSLFQIRFIQNVYVLIFLCAEMLMQHRRLFYNQSSHTLKKKNPASPAAYSAFPRETEIHQAHQPLVPFKPHFCSKTRPEVQCSWRSDNLASLASPLIPSILKRNI